METKKQITIQLTSRKLSNFILSTEHKQQHTNEDEFYGDIINFQRINYWSEGKARASSRTQDTAVSKEKISR